jgi:hypothetical protein
MVTQSQAAKPVRMAAVAVIAGVMAIAAACSTGTAGSGGTTTSPPAHSASPVANKSVCKHVDSARMSLESLTHLQLSASSAGKIRTDLTNINTQLAMLKGKGGAALSSSVSRLSASLKKVEKAAKGLSSPPSAGQIIAIISALSALRAQSRSTIAAMRAACP